MTRPTETRPEQIGRYRLVQRAGFGSQGVVYEALDPELERRVAIKLLDPDPQIDADVTAAALAEARAAARLDHAAIATIFDFGMQGDRPYLVFRYIPGIDLASFLDGMGAIGARDVWAIMEPVLRGIAHAHDRGVAHLDLKPHNIRVTPEGEPKVLDFGLATFFTRERSGRKAQAGTPRYMSPEQIDGGALGPPTDVFALCVILFEMLAGTPSRHVERWVKAGAVGADGELDLKPLRDVGVSDAALEVLRAGLLLDPGARIQDAGSLADRLKEAWAVPPATDAIAQQLVQFVIRRLESRGDIPAFPKVVLDVNRMTSERSVATVNEIANVVLRDSALSTRLLRLANSAFHSTRVKATRVSDAVSRLGLEQVRVAANAMGYFGAMTRSESHLSLREVVLVSFASALVARHFARSLELETVEEAMLCGMLFNTGEHLVMHCLPEEHEAIRERTQGYGDAARQAASREVLGVDYATLGAAVAETWHLPEAIVTAIGWRGASQARGDEGAGTELPRLAAAANALCEGVGRHAPEDAAPLLEELVEAHGDVLRVDAEALREVCCAMARKLAGFAPALGINPETSDYLGAVSAWFPEAEGEGDAEPDLRRRA